MSLERVAMSRPFPAVLFDEAHNEAWSIRPDIVEQMNPRNPGDAGYLQAAAALREHGMRVEAHTSGALTPEVLRDVDVVILAHPSEGTWERVTGGGSPKLSDDEIAAVETFVRDGGGLVVLAECEQDKYGNNLVDLLDRFGVRPLNITVQDTVNNHRQVATWVLADLSATRGAVDIRTRVDNACFYRAGALQLTAADAEVLARTSSTADPAAAPLAAALTAGRGRVAVFADSDLFGDDSIGDYQQLTLWTNVVTWAAGGRAAAGEAGAARWTDDSSEWAALKAAVEDIRPLQSKDGSIDGDTLLAAARIDDCVEAIEALAPRFPHDSDYLAAVARDLRKWRDGGFGVPDFLDSLLAFHPERQRVDGLEHLVVFPMYTQNGNPNRNLEAVVVKVVWPAWLADLEMSRYDNPMFVPIAFVDFTPGYDTNSAVLFPETVAVREIPKFTWGRSSAIARRRGSAASPRRRRPS
jgi:hypothetical protein